MALPRRNPGLSRRHHGRRRSRAWRPRSVRLPGDRSGCASALSRDVVAALATGDDVESVLATDEDASAVTLDTSADTLLTLHTAAGAGRFAVEALTAEATVLAEGTPGGARSRRSGPRRLHLAAAAPATLRVRGALEERRSSARTARCGRAATSPSPARAPSSSATAAGRSWPGSSARRRAHGRFGRRREPAPARSALPAELRLEGHAQLSPSSRASRRSLQVRSATPLVTVLSPQRRRREVDVHTDATTSTRCCPGALRAAAAALLGSASSGRPSSSDTRRAHRRGARPRGPAGSRRLARLLVPGGAGGPVGLGVRASAEVAEATLLDADGPAAGHGRDPDADPGAGPATCWSCTPPRTAPPRGAPGRGRPGAALDRPALEVVRRYFEPDAARRPLLEPLCRGAAGGGAGDEGGRSGRRGERNKSKNERRRGGRGRSHRPGAERSVREDGR